MTGFRVGIMDFNLVSRPTAESLTRVGYLNALANRVDSFWVPDHLNGLFPRSLWKQKYCGATKLVPTLGRAILGLGPGEREGNEPYGVDWSKPVARFEEGDGHHPRAVGFGRPTRQPRLTLFPAAKRAI